MTRKKSSQLFVDYYKEWIETYKVGAISDVTLNKYYKTLEQLRRFMPLLKLVDLDRRQYQLLINWYAETHEKQTTMDFHHQVKSCIHDMFHDGLIDRDPTHKCVIKGKESTINKKDKFLQIDELTKLLKSLTLHQGLNWDWFILLVAKTGLRFAEALALTPDDFDFANNTLTVNETWDYKSTTGGFKTTKTESSVRTISIDWQIVGQFRPLLEGLPNDEPIFVEKNENGHYKRVFNSTVNNKLAAYCKQLAIPVISLHSLRHTHASVLLAAGVSIHSISARLGHSNVTVTQETYAHILDDLHQKDNQIIINTLMQIA